MPKILLLRSSAHVGGVERQLLDCALFLQSVGWRPSLGCLYRGPGAHPLVERARRFGLSAETIHDTAWYSRSTFAAVRDLIRRLQPDLIHTCDYRSDVLAFRPGRVIPHVAVSHGFTSESGWMPVWNRLDLEVLKRVDAVVAVSTSWETFLASRGLSPSRLRTIENSRVVLSSRTENVPYLGGRGGPHLIYAGRFSPEKGLDLLLAAWPQIRTLYPDAQLWVLGSGASRPSRYHRRIANSIQQDGVHPVGFRPGVRSWFVSADAVIVPSRQEAWGGTAFEALCCGTPTIAARVGGLPSFCRDAPHAYLIPPNCPDAIVEALSEVLGKSFPRGPEVGRLFCSQPRFDPERRNRQLLDLYESLL